jgi:hypothetical protein
MNETSGSERAQRAASGYSHSVRFLLVALAACLLGGCVTVRPFEREVLAREDMTFDGNEAVAGAEAHSADTREGSSGGFGAGGGGCGCN